MNITNYLKIAGKSRILEIKPFRIRGVNPKLTFLESGNEFVLPRFSSYEMKQARIMNRISHQQIKNPIERIYNKATKQDLKRLTSKTIEDSYSRAEQTNPKDGKVYNLLKTKEHPNGNITIRILDQDGAFIKEAVITPKTILIPDDFSEKGDLFDLTHGEEVLTFAKRNNPFAKYIKLPISKEERYSNKTTEIISQYLKQNNDVDYISLSSGIEISCIHKIKSGMNTQATNSPFDFDSFINPNQRILISAGNGRPETKGHIEQLANAYLCHNQKVEGVGALNSYNGKIADYSQSTNSQLTQHYELGEFTPRLTKYGLNITGLPGTDIPLPEKFIEKYRKNPLLGQSIQRVQHLLTTIDQNITHIKNKQIKILKEEKNIFKSLQEYLKLEKQKIAYKSRKLKIQYYITQFLRIDDEYNVAIPIISGTSFTAPIRTAKLALNDMMENII